MEAIILTIDVACMVYLCWRLFKMDSKTNPQGGLGWFSYQKDDNA